MLDGKRILESLYNKHPNEFILLKIAVSESVVTLVDLIEQALHLVDNTATGSDVIHLRHFCIPLLLKVSNDYYNNPEKYLHLEI